MASVAAWLAFVIVLAATVATVVTARRRDALPRRDADPRREPGDAAGHDDPDSS